MCTKKSFFRHHFFFLINQPPTPSKTRKKQKLNGLGGLINEKKKVVPKKGLLCAHYSSESEILCKIIVSDGGPIYLGCFDESSAYQCPDGYRVCGDNKCGWNNDCSCDQDCDGGKKKRVHKKNFLKFFRSFFIVYLFLMFFIFFCTKNKLIRPTRFLKNWVCFEQL